MAVPANALSLPPQPARKPFLESRTLTAGIAPSLRELLLLFLFSGVLFGASALWLHARYHLLPSAGDEGAYMATAEAIRHWDFRSAVVQHFMGYPYAVAALSALFHLPMHASICLVATAASLVASILVFRLFGAWVAAYFALTNFAWLQASFLGGSETLAVALGLAALWKFRTGHTPLAALLGALATTVRPLMIFVLVGTGLVLLYQRRRRDFLVSLGIGLAVGLLYMLPLALYFGDPLLTVHTYTSRDYGAIGISGPHGHLFGWPFHGIIAGTMAYPAPWTNLVLSFFWIGLVLAGVVMMFSHRFREYAKAYPAEATFCGLYLLAVFCYDYLVWARGTFIRFCIPGLPFVFYALLRWLPKRRWLLWTLATVAPVLAALSSVGIKNVIHFR